MIKICLIGASGKMGRAVIEEANNQNDIEMLKNTNYACLVKNDNFDSSLINMDNLIKSSEPSPKGWADVIKTAIQKIKT